jgi:hypothetical protein
VLNQQGSWSYDAKSNNVFESPTYKMQFVPAPDGVIGMKALMFQPQDPALIRSLLLSNSKKKRHSPPSVTEPEGQEGGRRSSDPQ